MYQTENSLNNLRVYLALVKNDAIWLALWSHVISLNQLKTSLKLTWSRRSKTLMQPSSLPKQRTEIELGRFDLSTAWRADGAVDGTERTIEASVSFNWND